MRDIYDLLSEYETERNREPLPRSQSISFGSYKFCGFLMIVSLVCLPFKKNVYFYNFGLVTIALAWVSSLIGLNVPVLAELVNIRKGLRALSYPVETSLTRSASLCQNDYDFSDKLTSCDQASLRFLAKRMHTHAEGMRSRVGMVIGSIEKVGLIPLGIAFSLALLGYWLKVKNGELPIDAYSFWLGAGGLVLLTVVGTVRITASRRIDELAEIVEIAVEKQGQRNPVDPGADTMS